MPDGNLPSYLAAAKPNPMANRAAWYKNTAQVYAGIMLWFVFWQSIPGLKAPAAHWPRGSGWRFSA